MQPLIKSGKMLATIEQSRREDGRIGIDYGMRGLAGENFERLGQDRREADYGEGSYLIGCDEIRKTVVAARVIPAPLSSGSWYTRG